MWTAVFAISVTYGVLLRLAVAVLRRKTRLFDVPLFYLKPFAGWAMGIAFSLLLWGSFLAIVLCVSRLFPALGLSSFLNRTMVVTFVIFALFGLHGTLVEFTPRPKPLEPEDWLADPEEWLAHPDH